MAQTAWAVAISGLSTFVAAVPFPAPQATPSQNAVDVLCEALIGAASTPAACLPTPAPEPTTPEVVTTTTDGEVTEETPPTEPQRKRRTRR